MNDLQRQAAEAPDGYVQIIAGPGTGKTVTIIGRVTELLGRGIEPRRIVVLTFTRAAAREIKQRVAAKLGKECAIVVGTFHSVAYRYLRRFGGPEYSKLSVIDDTEKREILQTIVDDKSQIKKLAHEISRIQVFGEPPKDSHVRQVYNEYVRLTELCHRTDYDGLLLLFKRFLGGSAAIQEATGAVLVDEFQDTSCIQLEIAVLMASQCQNLTVVGDPDQSIYAFRNAEPRNFELMLAMVPKNRTYLRYLEQNYRSEQPILDAAHRVISKRADRFAPKRRLMALARTREPSTNVVRYVKFRSQEEEAFEVVKHISMLLKCGVQPREICVLSRQSRDYRLLEAQLLNHSIKARMVGGRRVLMRPEVRAIVDYLRVALDNNDQLAILRTINVPPRKLGPVAIRAVCAGDSKLPSMPSIRDQPGPAFGSYTTVVDRLASILAEAKGPEETKQAIAYLTSSLFHEIPELSEVVDQFAAFIEEEADPDDERSFCEKFVSLWALQSGTDETRESSKDTSVTLSTIHSAKGLEWPIVFVVGAGRSDARSGGVSEESEHEEMRLLYVALTRAKYYLVVTSPCMKFDDRLALSEKTRTDFELTDRFNQEVLSRGLGRDIKLPQSKPEKKELAEPTYLGRAIDLADGFMLASEIPMNEETPIVPQARRNNPKRRKTGINEKTEQPQEKVRRDKAPTPGPRRPAQPSLLNYFAASKK